MVLAVYPLLTAGRYIVNIVQALKIAIALIPAIKAGFQEFEKDWKDDHKITVDEIEAIVLVVFQHAAAPLFNSVAKHYGVDPGAATATPVKVG